MAVSAGGVHRSVAAWACPLVDTRGTVAVKEWAGDQAAVDLLPVAEHWVKQRLA